MKTSVKFILISVLLMLSFSMGGYARNVAGIVYSNGDDVCQVSVSSSNSNSLLAFGGQDINGFSKSQSLSFSDVELGFQSVSEIYSYTNNLRLRRIIEISDFLKDVMQKFCLLRENLLVLDQSKFYNSSQEPHYAEISSDYYVFALRRILI